MQCSYLAHDNRRARSGVGWVGIEEVANGINKTSHIQSGQRRVEGRGGVHGRAGMQVRGSFRVSTARPGACVRAGDGVGVGILEVASCQTTESFLV